MKKVLFITLSFIIIISSAALAGHQGSGVQTCTTCHTPNLITQHGGFSSQVCWKCHSSTRQEVINTIAAGSQGQPVLCNNCHGAGTHLEKHPGYISNWATMSGVKPGSAAIWTQPTAYTTVNPASNEYQVCFKCHSSYKFGIVPNGVTAMVSTSGVNLTDTAMEFNIANKSAHPVQATLNSQSGATSPKALASSQMKSPWTNVGNQTMNCSACHGTTASGTPTKYLIKEGWSWPTRPDTGKFWALGDIKNNQGSWQTKMLCAMCHPMISSGKFLNKVHDDGDHHGNYSIGGSSYSGIPCVSCHLQIPHGGKRSRLIVYQSDVYPYAAKSPSGASMAVLSGFRKMSPWNYSERDCYSTVNACNEHKSYSGTYEP